MVVNLFPRTDNSPFLGAQEIAFRIQRRFEKCVVDWAIAADELESELEHLIRLGTPQPIIQGHKNLFGKVVSIEVCSTPDLDNGFKFFAYPDSSCLDR